MGETRVLFLSHVKLELGLATHFSFNNDFILISRALIKDDSS